MRMNMSFLVKDDNDGPSLHRKIHEKAQSSLDLRKPEDTVTIDSKHGFTFIMEKTSATLKSDTKFIVPYSHGKIIDSQLIGYLIELDAFIDNDDAKALYEKLLDEENSECVRDILNS